MRLQGSPRRPRTDLVQARHRAYTPLLELGRTEEALSLVDASRQIAERLGDPCCSPTYSAPWETSRTSADTGTWRSTGPGTASATPTGRSLPTPSRSDTPTSAPI
ncbi:hypothetical protein ACFQ2B_35785 [Streptomyces stramineus]